MVLYYRASAPRSYHNGRWFALLNERAFVSALLVLTKRGGDMMYITVTELFLFASLIVSIISLLVTIYSHKK